MGHVGAAELFVEMLNNQGIITFLSTAHHGDMGEYPPLFAATLGAWWNIFGEPPDHLLIRVFGLSLVLVSAFAVSAFTRRLGGPGDFAYVLALFTPLSVGIGRHFMPEVMVMMFCTLFASCALKYQQENSLPNAITAGMVFGLGMLTKQTFIITAAPLIFIMFNKSKPFQNAIALFTTLLVALPWHIFMWNKQREYINSSVEANQNADIFEHISATFSIIGWDILGPPLCIALVYAVWTIIKSRNRTHTLLIAWIACTIVVFIFIPKKYPRLMLGISPALITLIALSFKGRSRIQISVSAASIIWIVYGSIVQLPSNAAMKNIDDRCPQIWFRPPSDKDLGYLDIIRAMGEHKSASIAVVNPPSIPCEIQSAHDWILGLDPFLRHHGYDTEITVTDDLNSPQWRNADIQVMWHGTPLETPLPLTVNVKMDEHNDKR